MSPTVAAASVGSARSRVSGPTPVRAASTAWPKPASSDISR
ncbi:hypothetical protein ACIBSR_17770 [Streptomyces sp. NPDC049936]